MCSSVGPGTHPGWGAPGRCPVFGFPGWAGTCPGVFWASAAGGPSLVMLKAWMSCYPRMWGWRGAWGGFPERCPGARAVSRATIPPDRLCSARSLSGCHLCGMPAPLETRACCHTVPLPSGSAEARTSGTEFMSKQHLLPYYITYNMSTVTRIQPSNFLTAWGVTCYKSPDLLFNIAQYFTKEHWALNKSLT